MIKITLKIDGMMCGMCVAHMNDTIRKAFKIKKVSSSHKKGESIIITENGIEDEKLIAVIEEIGYKVLKITKEPYKKKFLIF